VRQLHGEMEIMSDRGTVVQVKFSVAPARRAAAEEKRHGAASAG
jgi:hypothetical protein